MDTHNPDGSLKSLKQLEDEDKARKQEEYENRGGPKAVASRKKLKDLENEHKAKLKKLNEDDKKAWDDLHKKDRSD